MGIISNIFYFEWVVCKDTKCSSYVYYIRVYGSLYVYGYVRCVCYYLIFPLQLKDEKRRNVVINKVCIIKTVTHVKHKNTTWEYCFQYIDDEYIYKTDWIHFKKLLIEKGSSYQYTTYKGPYGIPYLKRGTRLQKEISEGMKQENIEKYVIKQANTYRIKSVLVLFTSVISVLLLCLLFVIYGKEMYYHPHPFVIILLIIWISCIHMFVSMYGKHKTKNIPIVVNDYDIKKRV